MTMMVTGQTMLRILSNAKFWWDRVRSIGVQGSDLRNLWNVTDLYNDVEDFWFHIDQGNHCNQQE